MPLWTTRLLDDPRSRPTPAAQRLRVPVAEPSWSGAWADTALTAMVAERRSQHRNRMIARERPAGVPEQRRDQGQVKVRLKGLVAEESLAEAPMLPVTVYVDPSTTASASPAPHSFV